MEKWFVTAKRADFNEIAKKYHITPVLARIIRNRDRVEDKEIELYLNGTLEDLYSPWLLKDMKQGVSILQKKIKEQKKIRVIGDYDIDGVTATHILLTGLKRCGAWVDTDIPDRLKDGYGINEQLIKKAKEEEVDTILTCDNGIAAIEQISFAKELGMTVIVTDHHEVLFVEEKGERTYLKPPADAVINPKQQECTYPFREICGAVVAYKLVEALYETFGIPREEVLDLLEFAAVATVGDIMDLLDENRIIVKEGLKRLENTRNLGLRALIDCNGLGGGKITAYHIGFVLGPCINASGRLDTAKRALRLLGCKDKTEAVETAADLKALNDSRKEMTAEGTEAAIKKIEESGLVKDKVFVLYLENCHESLAGIIAGRIKEKYHKPVFVLTQAEDGVKGSGRSIEAYSMFEEMSRCKELFTKFGGHKMAAGLSLKEENVPIFRQRINELCTLKEEDFVEKVTIDVPMPIHYITETFIKELGLLEPFGKGNPKPVFAEKNLRILSAVLIGKNKNVMKMRVQNDTGFSIGAVYFQKAGEMAAYIVEKFGKTEADLVFAGKESLVSLSLTYYPTINEFNGNRTLQINILNYQ